VARITSIGTSTNLGSLAFGMRNAASLPREGSRSPRKKSTARMTRNGMSVGSPCSALPWDVSQLGNHVCTEIARIHCCVAPKTSATITTTGNDRNRPTSAAASAGTMSRVIW